MSTHIYIYIYIYIHIHIHIHINTFTHIHMHTCTHTHTHALSMCVPWQCCKPLDHNYLLHKKGLRIRQLSIGILKEGAKPSIQPKPGNRYSRPRLQRSESQWALHNVLEHDSTSIVWWYSWDMQQHQRTSTLAHHRSALRNSYLAKKYRYRE